jgi:ADP-ribose pyrophosphatase YjhB (NUDIX family)
MRIRVSAVAVESGSVLTIRFNYAGLDVFALPGGGVERGEPVLDALVREWRDELGFRITPGRLLLVGDAPGSKRHPRTLHLVFEAEEVAGKGRLIRGESGGSDISWIPVEELPELPLYPDIGSHLPAILDHSQGPLFVPNCMERGYW